MIFLNWVVQPPHFSGGKRSCELWTAAFGSSEDRLRAPTQSPSDLHLAHCQWLGMESEESPRSVTKHVPFWWQTVRNSIYGSYRSLSAISKNQLTTQSKNKHQQKYMNDLRNAWNSVVCFCKRATLDCGPGPPSGLCDSIPQQDSPDWS
jgi:hypothetical protein